MGMFAKSVPVMCAVVAGSLLVGACGGGGSNSGGGSSGNFAGTYRGQDRLFQTGAGANNAALPSRSVRAVINSNNEITLNDGNNVFRGRLNGFSYTMRSQLQPRFLANFNDVCGATITHSGTVANGAISGRYFQDGTCNRLGRVVVSGTYFLSSGRNQTRANSDTGASSDGLVGRAHE